VPKRDVDGFDVEAALIGLGAPVSEPVEAGFFHRTLARWLGLPEGRPPGSRSVDVSWSYAFWKAELVRLWGNGGRQIWTAQVFRGPQGPAEIYEYWIDLDERARIKRSGWLTSAPDLLAEHGGFAPPLVDQGAVARLFEEPGDDSDESSRGGTP
jgi:hypothetical protein